MDEVERRWEELDRDCLVNILGRVGVESLLLDVPFVCKSWHKASFNPLCWQRIIFSDIPKCQVFGEPLGLFDEIYNQLQFNLTNQAGSFFLAFDPFINKFVRKYGIEWSRFSVTAFLKLVVGRSNGNVTFLRLPDWCEQAVGLQFVADLCTGLKYLSLPTCLMCDRTLPELIGKWKNMEAVCLGSTYDFETILAQISIHCNNFDCLRVGIANICKDEALAIVNQLPKIKYLILRRAFIPRDSLVILLKGCKQLVLLDVRDCVGFEGDDEIRKLASHISKFRCEGSRVHDDSDGISEVVSYHFDPELIYNGYLSD